METLIREWVRSDVANRPDVQAVILAGSRAYGDALPSSDIDLCYVARGEGAQFRRERAVMGPYTVEIMWGTWAWYDDVIERHERASPVGTITEMLARGILLWGGGEYWEDLRRRAETRFRDGPDPADADRRDALTRAYVQLAARWAEACGVQRQWLWHTLVRESLDALFLLRRWWAVKPHRELAALRDRSPALYALFVDALTCSGGTARIASRIQSEVFGLWEEAPTDDAVTLRPITEAERPIVREFLMRRWGSFVMMAGGVPYQTPELPAVGAFVRSQLVGLITYVVGDEEVEIVSLDSAQPGRGIGGALLEAAKEVLHQHGKERLHLVTSNDNLHALGFYLRRGFRLGAVHVDAVTRARVQKPEIPVVGDHGIPIRDEWELWWPPDAAPRTEASR